MKWVRDGNAGPAFHIPYTRPGGAKPLSIQLSVLRAIMGCDSVTDKQGRLKTVQLEGWPMSRDTITALKELPEWVGRIDISTCVWPHGGGDYALFVECMPTTCLEWVVGNDDSVMSGVRMALCENTGAWRYTYPQLMAALHE